MARGRARDLPLFWKLLLPFLTLVVLLGSVSVFLVIHDASARQTSVLDTQLAQHSLDARSALHDRKLYVVESVNFAANLQGMAEAVQHRDTAAVRRLLGSVAALKPGLSRLLVLDAGGLPLVSLARSAPRAPMLASTSRSGVAFGAALVRRHGTDLATTLIASPPLLAEAAPVCSGAAGCHVVGAAVAAVDARAVAAAALTATGGAATAHGGRVLGLALFDPHGARIATAGEVATSRPPALPQSSVLRRYETLAGRRVAAMYTTFDVDGADRGTVEVVQPTTTLLSSIRTAATRLGLLALIGMIGVVAVGALLSKLILGQVRPLLETSRRLGRGDLTARAPVRGRDEIGELAQGVNQMAADLEGMYETLEHRVAQRTEEVHRLLQERTDFFAGMSHEFRTPLAVILNQSTLLADDPDVTVRESAASISISARQLLRFVNDILELANSETSGLDIVTAPLSLADVLGRLDPTLRGLANSAGLSYTVDLDEALPPVLGDADRVGQVLLNLVDNAVKYTPTGGSVTVHVSHRDDVVEVSVADTGVGIPESAAGRIFEPFYRVRGTRTQRGEPSSGLGLALARRLVELQGGSIAFTSTAAGTVFTVALPAGEGVAPNSASAVTRTGDPPRPRGRGRVRRQPPAVPK